MLCFVSFFPQPKAIHCHDSPVGCARLAQLRTSYNNVGYFFFWKGGLAPVFGTILFLINVLACTNCLCLLIKYAKAAMNVLGQCINWCPLYMYTSDRHIFIVYQNLSRSRKITFLLRSHNDHFLEASWCALNHNLLSEKSFPVIFCLRLKSICSSTGYCSFAYTLLLWFFKNRNYTYWN